MRRSWEEMVSRKFPESDWKIFRRLRELALERFSERVLIEVRDTMSEPGKSAHDRYLQVYRLLQERDHEMASAFNDSRRSTAMMQLAVIHSHQLLEPDEVSEFTASTRETLEFFAADRLAK